MQIDNKRNRRYIGSHYSLTPLTDGYIGSNKHLQMAVKKRPETFQRIILEFHSEIAQKDLLKREQMWLSLIPVNKLGKEFFNEKRVAAGGDIISFLSEEKQKQHAEKSRLASKKYWDNISETDMAWRKEDAFGGNTFDRSYMAERQDKLFAKIAKIRSPAGEEFIVRNITKFCKERGINYGNMKTVLRGERISAKGYKGSYEII